jgi:hypothetical protein
VKWAACSYLPFSVHLDRCRLGRGCLEPYEGSALVPKSLQLGATRRIEVAVGWRHLSGVPRYEPGYQYQSQSPISPGLVHPVPLSPMPNIQWGTTSGGWGSPLYTPFYAQPYEWPQVSNQGPLQTMQHPSPLRSPSGVMWNIQGTLVRRLTLSTSGL